MVVLWRITGHCNLGCVFCGYSRELSRPRLEVPADEIRRVARLLGDWQSECGRRVLLSWLGGEPFLRKDLTRLSGYASNDCGLRVSTTTNGLALVSPKLRRHIIDTYAELTVSVDGIGEEHDRLRQRPGGFAMLRDSIRKLVAERRRRDMPLLRINTVLMRGNIRRFPEFCREVTAWGVDEITFNQLGGIDRPDFYPENRLLVEQVGELAAILPALGAELERSGVTLRGGSDYLRRLEATAQGVALQVDDCGPGEQFLFIDESGCVGPCSFTGGDYGIPLHELQTPADLEVLPSRFRAARNARCAPGCRDCHSTRVAAKFHP